MIALPIDLSCKRCTARLSARSTRLCSMH